MTLDAARQPSSGFRLLGVHTEFSAPVAWREGRLLAAADLRREVSRVASALTPAAEGDQVLVVCSDQWDFAVAALAAWHRGYVIALPPSGQPKALLDLTAQAPIRRTLHDGGDPAGLRGGLDVRKIAGGETPIPEVLEIPAERTLAVLYTSGTTGTSVAWAKSAQQLLSEAQLQAQLLRTAAGSRILVTAPPQHIYGLLMGILVPLVGGAAWVCGRALLPEAISALALASGATHLASVPAHLRALSLATPEGLGKVQTIVSSSAPLEPEVAQAFTNRGVRVIELLGSTETGGIAFRSPPEVHWRPLPGVEVGIDAEGSMLLSSPFLDRSRTGPFATADRIALLPNGDFSYLGRSDGVVKVGGRRVEIGDLERRIRLAPGVMDAAVRAFTSSGSRGNELWAMVAGSGLDPDSLRTALRAHFDPAVLPRRWRLLTSLPRTPSGKITDASWQEVFEGPKGAPQGSRPVARQEAAGAPSRREVVIRERLATRGPDNTNIQVQLWVPPDLLHFRGHFDGFPILSGVFILNELVLKESRSAWPDLRAVKAISQVKFRRPIAPDSEVVLTLQRDEPQPTVQFSLAVGDHACASGAVIFEVLA